MYTADAYARRTPKQRRQLAAKYDRRSPLQIELAYRLEVAERNRALKAAAINRARAAS